VTGAGQAVVVGATGTIGQAVIRRLTGRGMPVLAVARGQDDLTKLASADELVTPAEQNGSEATRSKPARRWMMVANTVSKSPSLLAFRMSNCSPRVRAASSTSLSWLSASG
jgi:NAD(P)-dependent dehydrogenase (short-subunit alcohol dehydrogenase family)